MIFCDFYSQYIVIYYWEESSKQKGRPMNSPSTADRLSEVRLRIYGDSRVALSEFARGKTWRSKLQSNEFMELQEHGERMAWLISEDGMRGIVDYISELEGQVERASIRAMFDVRNEEAEWKTGADLRDAALSFFRDNEDELMETADK